MKNKKEASIQAELALSTEVQQNSSDISFVEQKLSVLSRSLLKSHFRYLAQVDN